SINLRTDVEKVGSTSLTLIHTFHKDNKKLEKPVLAARAKIVIVAYDEKKQVKTQLPRELVEEIRKVHPDAF
ncbi:MAG: hypothetical protein ACFFC7_35380, partial [Candidatus Hermodarchaeota archaeon]